MLDQTIHPIIVSPVVLCISHSIIIYVLVMVVNKKMDDITLRSFSRKLIDLLTIITVHLGFTVMADRTELLCVIQCVIIMIPIYMVDMGGDSHLVHIYKFPIDHTWEFEFTILILAPESFHRRYMGWERFPLRI